MRAESIVWIVDDDPHMRQSIVWLLESAGYGAEAYATPAEFFEHYDPNRPGCLVLDLHLPEMSGLELVQSLRDRGCGHPFIVVSGNGNVSTAVASMHQGAVDFIEKPFDHARLLRCVDRALQRDRIGRQRRRADSEFHARLDSLTPREREVMELVAEGLLTKQIAKRLGISPKTVEVHRSHVTKKMHVQSVPQLVRLLTQHTIGASLDRVARAGRGAKPAGSVPVKAG